MASRPPLTTPLEVVNHYWGYSTFRPLQEQIIDSVLSGKDTLGLMPTGGGKSISFQVPGLMLPGITVVITPLISLMKDQVDNLRKRRIRAVYLHASMTLRERNLAMEQLLNGRAKFLYISPERLKSEQFLAQLRQLRISLIVVDEAHCISQWGYDFRPSYLGIKVLRNLAPSARLLALTATATEEVCEDIVRSLEMSEPSILRMSFERANISYIVRPSETKINEVCHILNRTTGSAIVYVRSRKRTREIADFLKSSGISAKAYHAGMDFEHKESHQNEWQQGRIRVMVATNAFGMGIDKSDVRVVIHYDLPPSLEEYYQEAGRAGRDGEKSYAVLLLGRNDRSLLKRHLTEAFPERDRIKEIYERVCNNLEIAIGEGYESLKEFDLDKFCRTFGYQERQCRAALRLLGQAGYLDYIEDSDRRAKAMITMTREELYNAHGLTRNAELVLSRMLRLYTGLFMDYQPINENTIAGDLGISAEEVYSALLELGRAKVMSYIPRSRVPMIYFPTSREERRYVQIGKEIYEMRRASMARRIEAMATYAYGNSACRENILLRYFGETREVDCGCCDICRDKRKRNTGKSEMPDLIEAVMNYMKENPGGIDFRILSHRLQKPADILSRAMVYLCSEGYLELRDGCYYLRQHGK